MLTEEQVVGAAQEVKKGFSAGNLDPNCLMVLNRLLADSVKTRTISSKIWANIQLAKAKYFHLKGMRNETRVYAILAFSHAQYLKDRELMSEAKSYLA